MSDRTRVDRRREVSSKIAIFWGPNFIPNCDFKNPIAYDLDNSMRSNWQILHMTSSSTKWYQNMQILKNSNFLDYHLSLGFKVSGGLSREST